MPREISGRIDALFVEGMDDRAVVNAFIKRATGLDLAARQFVRECGGDAGAFRKFDDLIKNVQVGGRVGLIVDRDTSDNDKWPTLRARLRALGAAVSDPAPGGTIVDGRFGIWMWPDNVSHGDVETFVAGIVPQSAALTYANEVCRVVKEIHGAEFEVGHSRKAALKVRSVWRDASAAGGYGHLVRNLTLTETPASIAFLAWFGKLFLT